MTRVFRLSRGFGADNWMDSDVSLRVIWLWWWEGAAPLTQRITLLSCRECDDLVSRGRRSSEASQVSSAEFARTQPSRFVFPSLSSPLNFSRIPFGPSGISYIVCERCPERTRLACLSKGSALCLWRRTKMPMHEMRMKLERTTTRTTNPVVEPPISGTPPGG